MTIELKHLDNRHIRIDVSWDGVTKILRGWAKFNSDPDLGLTLGVVIEDPAGPFEVLLPVDSWTSEILPDSTGESDFRICLDSFPT